MPTVYGNNKRISGSYTIYDTDNRYPSGDIREKCGNTAFYRFYTNSHSSYVSGYCLNLPGNPAGYTISYSGALHTTFDPNGNYAADAGFRLEKKEKMDFPKDQEIG